MTPAPTLSTQRLRLRPMAPGDFPAYAALMASDRAVGMGGPFGERAARGMFCHDAAGRALFGHGALMVEAGDATLGQGYATEAARALRDWAFAQGRPGLVSYVDPGNRASARVAERLGAWLDTAARGQDPGDLVFRHLVGRA